MFMNGVDTHEAKVESSECSKRICTAPSFEAGGVQVSVTSAASMREGRAPRTTGSGAVKSSVAFAWLLSGLVAEREAFVAWRRNQVCTEPSDWQIGRRSRVSGVPGSPGTIVSWTVVAETALSGIEIGRAHV